MAHSFEIGAPQEALTEWTDSLTPQSAAYDSIPPGVEIVEAGPSGYDGEAFALGTTGFLSCIDVYFSPVQAAPQAGDLVVYAEEQGSITHVGTLTADARVISKWGFGPVVRHQLDHVPVEYGNEVRFFRLSEEDMARIRQEFPRRELAFDPLRGPVLA